MNQLSKSDLENIFVDVRKAYRLLYFYQRRVLDTVKFISGTLSKNIRGGWALFSDNAPKNGSGINMDTLAWDWLNMYDYEFNFQDESINGNSYKFAIAVQSDSGFYDVMNNISESTVESFSPVEQAVTKIYFCVGRNTWKPGDSFQKAKRKDANDEFIYQEEGTDNLFITKRFDLSDCRDEESILGCLRTFKKFCEDNGINEFIIDI
ncbi:hypothetical protein OCK74_14880 [Chitinophagaceae bacterium LB-8]|uniref:Uncharacterized protein n=1 Tax=Paraflavisolibacter caeni TaxID=2982496 RepID=A0A9X3BIT1_9BACT|nr:hypothetical protein [Paraflavisolibacter caeni]MCU7550403.1 hypothetical protein [Paraflavisolibacter caeni]